MKYNLIIKDAFIIDGSGGKGYAADVGIYGEKIAFIGRPDEHEAAEVINAGGLTLAPGFIDIHGHSDESIIVDPFAPSKIHQGVTTEVFGNCGASPAPLLGSYLEEYKRSIKKEMDIDVSWKTMEEYLSLLERQGVGINCIVLAGQGTIRGSVVGLDNKKPSKDEMGKMKELLLQCLEAGAWGMSTGLIYAPSQFADTDELIELVSVFTGTDYLYASHIRGEGDTLIDAVGEAIRIGQSAGVPLQISHHKASGEKNWGKVRITLQMMEEARLAGVDVTCDQYPYIASSTSLASAVMPSWSLAGDNNEFMKRLKDENVRRKILEEIRANKDRDWSKVFVSQVASEKNKFTEGKNILQLAEIAAMEPADYALKLLFEEEGDVAGIFFSMCEDDLELVMRYPHTSFGSDATARSPSGILAKGRPHPRSYGTFPRILGRYAREKKILTLEESVRKMTSLTAGKLMIPMRGLIKEDYFADLVLFDKNKIIDTAAYGEPHRFPEGIKYVIINGKIAVKGNRHTGVLAGKVLRKKLHAG